MPHSTVLYKYRSWHDEYHKRCLLENELFFSAPDDMNDPFDFKIPADFSLLDSEDKIRKYIEYGYSHMKPEQKNKIVDKELFIRNYIMYFKQNADKFQSEYNRKEFERANKHFGVLCFSQRWDSILMWTHYANNHKGFCLGFKKDELIKANIGADGPVNYKDTFPSIDPLELNEKEKIVIQSHTKAIEWEYEQEYRFSKISFPNIFTNKSRVYNFSDNFLEEIILGLNIQDDHKNQIIKLARDKNIPVYRIVKKPKSFIFEKLPLNNS